MEPHGHMVGKITPDYGIYMLRKVNGRQDAWFPNDAVAWHVVIWQSFAM